jgi:cobalt/nickel transport system ATP-binding protein
MTNTKAVEIRSLCFSYPDGTSALEEVSVEVEAGERVALIGANGAGKSTLLLHLNGIYLPNGQRPGEVHILGVMAEKKNLKAIRQKVGLVFQDPDDQLFCPTVFDDVAFGPRNLLLPEEKVHQRVQDSLESVGLSGLAHRNSFHLSYGQKRRAAIATVLSMNVEILALDEPTSNLDPKGRKGLIDLLRKLDLTQIVVTHDFDLVHRLCHRAILMSEGRIVAEGSPAEILENQALLEAHGLA